MARDRIIFLLDGIHWSFIRSCRRYVNSHHVHQIRRFELTFGLDLRSKVRFYGPKLLLFAASPEFDYDDRSISILRSDGVNISDKMGHQATGRIFSNFEEMQQNVRTLDPTLKTA
jgi:hypothetical protein